MKDLVIFGTGGFAREVHQIVEDLNNVEPTWNFLGFLDGDPSKHGTDVHGHPVLGNGSWLSKRPDAAVSLGVGNPASKKHILDQLSEQGHSLFATLIHPRAWIGNRVSIGEGSTICAGTMITTDIELGRHVIVNLDCTIGHDAVLQEFVTVAPSVNISGSVQIGVGTDLGTGAMVIQGIQIGEWSIVGAGAVVVKDLEPNVTAVGIPAKVIKSREAGWHSRARS